MAYVGFKKLTDKLKKQGVRVEPVELSAVES